MKVLVLGMGMQGTALVADLIQSPAVEKVVVVDLNLELARQKAVKLHSPKLEVAQIDVTDHQSLVNLMRQGFTVIGNALLRRFNIGAAKAAIEAGVHMVDLGSPAEIHALDEAAQAAGVTLVPDCGLEPGIDLILTGYGVQKLDRVEEIEIYTGGIPQPHVPPVGPLRYKVSWAVENTIALHARGEATILQEGKPTVIAEPLTTGVKIKRFPEPCGEGECFYTGDRTFLVHTLHLPHIRNIAMWTVRWPGTCQVWKMLKDLGFMSEDPLPISTLQLSPRQFLTAHFTRMLAFQEGEEDMVVLQVEIRGEKGGKATALTYEMVDFYDKERHLTAMNRCTAFTCSIVCQMVGQGVIQRPGVLRPERDIPYEPFLQELAKRQFHIQERWETLQPLW